MKQYIMLKCLNCGHSFKSSVDTVRTRCSKCGKSKLIQVSALEESVISDVELLKKRLTTLEKFIMNNMQVPEHEPIHTPKPKQKANVKLEPESVSTPDNKSTESTPDIKVEPEPEPKKESTLAQKIGLVD